MVKFHHGLADELANGKSATRSLSAAAASTRLPCPVQHEEGCIDGQASLAYRLWQLLESAGASGLQISLLAARTNCSVDDVQTTLKHTRYFVQLPGQSRLAASAIVPHLGCFKA
jgi:hypothetical protein